MSELATPGAPLNELIEGVLDDLLLKHTAVVDLELAAAVTLWELAHGPSIFLLVEGRGAQLHEPDGYERVGGWIFESYVGPYAVHWIPGPVVLWARRRRWWSRSDRRASRILRKAMS